MIDFGVLKVTIDKIAIRKHHSLKETTSEITIGKRAIFKFGFSYFLRSKEVLVVFFIESKIQTHCFFFKNKQ